MREKEEAKKHSSIKWSHWVICLGEGGRGLPLSLHPRSRPCLPPPLPPTSRDIGVGWRCHSLPHNSPQALLPPPSRRPTATGFTLLKPWENKNSIFLRISQGREKIENLAEGAPNLTCYIAQGAGRQKYWPGVGGGAWLLCSQYEMRIYSTVCTLHTKELVRRCPTYIQGCSVCIFFQIWSW